MDIEFRVINFEDFEETKNFLIVNEYSWRDSDPQNYLEKTEEQITEFTSKFLKAVNRAPEKYRGFGAFRGDLLVGSQSLEIQIIDGRKACHIHGLWVDSTCRGNGIAKKLKLMGEVWAKEKQCDFMDTNVKVSNEPMKSLNQKLGYEIVRYNFRKQIK